MRAIQTVTLNKDLVVVGGGLSGVCAAVTAARGGASVVLIQDRPVLGGNASSEVRLWPLGATSHMGNNNRWSREGGVIDEIILENLYRNREGSPVFFDMVLFDLVEQEENVELLLNTAVHQVSMKNNELIENVVAFNSRNETTYIITGSFFCDASGDGILSYLSGAELLYPSDKSYPQDLLKYPDSFGEKLGSSIFFYTKKTNNPIQYKAPSFALQDISSITRMERVSLEASGCDYWWIEWGGDLDTIRDNQEITKKLWSVVYGIWDYIKNSGEFSGSEYYTLEWVGLISGKRESRRFKGDYILNQQDIVSQKEFPDVISYGGWAIDHHPSSGVFSAHDPCYQWHVKGIYQIPFRTMYSSNVQNLFFAGRLISVSPVAYGSTRVMMTAAHNAQAVGAASVLCLRNGVPPRALVENSEFQRKLQQYLLRDGQYIPAVPSFDPAVDKACSAKLEVSSEKIFNGFAPNGDLYPLNYSVALLFPLVAGANISCSLQIFAEKSSSLSLSLMKSYKSENYLPEKIISTEEVVLSKGEHTYECFKAIEVEESAYYFLVIPSTEFVSIRRSLDLIPGVMTVYQKFNPKVAKSAYQQSPQGSGVDSFPLWTPYAPENQQNLACTFGGGNPFFSSKYLKNGFHRPYIQTNCWSPDPGQEESFIALTWDKTQEIKVVLLFFDGSFDYSLEAIQVEHPWNVTPCCVRDFIIYDNITHEVLYQEYGNYQARKKVVLSEKVSTKSLKIEFPRTPDNQPVIVYDVQCF